MGPGAGDEAGGTPALDLLLIAPWCDAEDVGEAWVAHQWVKRLAARHRVTVLSYHRRARTPGSTQLPGVRFVEWPDLPVPSRLERFDSLLKPGWIPFYVRARRWLRRALDAGEHFDLAHQVVPVAMRYPCPVIGTGIPFLVGPVGGGLASPPGFAGDEDTDRWYLRLRELDAFRLRHDPLLRRTYEEAACVLGIAPYVDDHLRGLAVRRTEHLSETALEALPDDVPDRSTRQGTVRLLFVGRVIRTKGVRDAIRAVALARHEADVHLDVVGDGFDLDACRRLVQELSADDAVTFHGRVPREEVARHYRAADVFLFPSYREPGGNAVFEAMGYALPVVTTDRGGPGAAVDDASGVRITPVEPQRFARELADAVVALAADPARRRSMGDAARERVGRIGSWDGKVAIVEQLYRELLTGHVNPPA